jgi:hypothetical protein
MKGMNVIQLQEGGQVKITVDHDEGFINDIFIDGDLHVEPADALKQIEEHLKCSHLTTVAIYTRLRFFMLKNKVQLVNLDVHDLAEGIAAVQDHPMR